MFFVLFLIALFFIPYFRFSQQLSRIKLGPALAFLGIFKKKDERSEHDQIRAVISKGIVAKEEGDMKGANKAFHEALTMSTDFLNEEKITVNDSLNHKVFIYDQIANLYFEAGDLKTAEIVFIDTMKLALKLGMAEDDNAMIEMSLKVATIYLYTGKTDRAIIGLKDCIAKLESKLEAKTNEKTEEGKDNGDTKKRKEEVTNSKVLLGKTLKHFSHYYLQKRDFKSAKSLMERSLELSRETLGGDDDNTFVIMNDIATCKIMLEEYDSAEELLKEGIRLSGKAKSLMQSAFLSNLGALYIRMKKYSDAEKACKRGKQVAETANDKFLITPNEACLERLAQLNTSNDK